MPVSTPPTSLDECLFFISLVSSFLAVRFSVNSGRGRRRSVSTYAAILVLLSRSLSKEAAIEVRPERIKEPHFQCKNGFPQSLAFGIPLVFKEDILY